MSQKTQLITVVEEDNMDSINDMPLERDFEPKLSQTLLAQPFSASGSELDEEPESESESDTNLDPNDTLEVPHENSTANTANGESEEGSFRGRPSSCVFVASLAASLSDDELSLSVTKHFQQWGELALVKVLRDPSNRPYAFVQYTTDADAQKALKEGQHSVLDGRTIRCEPAKVNRTLYVATASGEDVGVKEIKSALEKFGEIEQFVGNNDSTFRKSNLNKAWFCKFAYRDDAIRAYANLRLSPDWIVEWAQNVDRPSTETLDRAESEIVIDKFSVFIGQLDAKVTKEKLSARFGRHGKISEIVLVIRPGNNFAFIKFETEKAAAAAVERENHAVFMEKTMHVQYRELHHQKSKYSNSTSPRLSLAPPPVNLPYRRASTGSGFNSGKQSDSSRQFAMISGVYQPTQPKPTRLSKYGMSGRAASFGGNERPQVQGSLRFHTPMYGPSSNLSEADFEQLVDALPTDHEAYSPTQKHSPVSSPSNNTVNSSHGEAKSVYSSSTISALEQNLHDDLTNPTTSGYSSSKFLHRRSLSHIVPPSSGAPMVQRPPSSYYYYALPKDNYVYDQSAYLTYASYPYYFTDSSMVDFPASGMSSAGHGPPAPYYMYYSVPQNFNESNIKQRTSFEAPYTHGEATRDGIDY